MADKAYLSEKNLNLVNDRGGVAFIPFKKGSRMNGEGARRRGDIWKTMYAYFYLHKEQFLNFYHKRSNVETTFSMIKGKFGERLRSKTYISQENEILAKILCHNICCVIHAMYELGIEPDFLKEQ